MRDCAERNSQPAGPARCLGDCKLSLRMQTDKRGRHHLPVLPSTTETAARAPPSLPPSYFYPSLHCQATPPPLFHPCARMFMKSLICFRRLPRAAAPPHFGRRLSCVDKMIFAEPFFPPRRSPPPLRGRCRLFGLHPVFYQFTSVILYSCSTRPRSCHRGLIDSQRDKRRCPISANISQALLKPPTPPRLRQATDVSALSFQDLIPASRMQNLWLP